MNLLEMGVYLVPFWHMTKCSYKKIYRQFSNSPNHGPNFGRATASRPRATTTLG